MFVHTQLVCQEMLKQFNSNNFTEEEKLILMFSALFHDIGKCRCENSDDGKLLSNGHPAISEKLTRKILWEMDIEEREKICEIVRWHDLYCTGDISDRKLLRKISQLSPWLFIHIDLLCNQFLADDHGSQKTPDKEGSSEKFVEHIEKLLDDYQFHLAGTMKDLGEFTIYIMCGLPGSGKSTWVSQNVPHLPVISRDLIREELGMTEKGVKFMGTPEQEDLVSQISKERVLEYCKNKQSFVYDNMNSREKYRYEFLMSVAKYHPIIRIIYLEVDDLDLLEDRRPEIACKGENVFTSMIEKMEFPRPYEYDTLQILQDLSSGHLVDTTLIGYLHIQETRPKNCTVSLYR